MKQRRVQVTTNLKLQRAAFKEVTSLKTWPLQQVALRDLEHWMSVHYQTTHQNTVNSSNDLRPLPECWSDNDAETHGDSTGLSSSSLDEPKRLRRKGKEDSDLLSPRKSTLRHQFRLEFLQEREIAAPVPFNHQSTSHTQEDDNQDKSTNVFQPALWCMEPRIFGVEYKSGGKRKYMVGHLGRFCDYYWRKTDPHHRHSYELIRDHTPCRLYLDLEFSKTANPTIDEETAEALVQDVCDELAVEFQRLYSIQVDRRHMMDLESSTPSKFSRHVILHLPEGHLFASAAAVGRFVRVLVGRWVDEIAAGTLPETRPTLAQYLFVVTPPPKGSSSHTTDETTRPPAATEKASASLSHEPPQKTNNNNKTCFIDLGVYTKNRLFRLLGSTKFGKPASAALRIASANQFPFPPNFTNASFYVPDMEPRATEVGGDGDMEVDMKHFLSAVDWTDHATALADTLVVPMNGSKLAFPILEESEEAKALIVSGKGGITSRNNGAQAGATLTNSAVLTQTRPAAGTTLWNSTVSAGGTSPYACLDDFIVREVGSRGGVPGAIRTWSVVEDPHHNSEKHLPISMTYQMSRNRWCERIGRPHRSNNIMWTVDFSTMTCVQTCHDPECAAMRFRGTPVPLPATVVEGIEEAVFEQQLALVDEQALLENRSMPSKKQDEFDEEEFEKALMALDLNRGEQTTTQERQKDKAESGSIDLDDTERTRRKKEDDLPKDDAQGGGTTSNPKLLP